MNGGGTQVPEQESILRKLPLVAYLVCETIVAPAAATNNYQKCPGVFAKENPIAP